MPQSENSMIDMLGLAALESIAADPRYAVGRVRFEYDANGLGWRAFLILGFDYHSGNHTRFVARGDTAARAVESLYYNVRGGLAVDSLMRGLRGLS